MYRHLNESPLPVNSLAYHNLAALPRPAVACMRGHWLESSLMARACAFISTGDSGAQEIQGRTRFLVPGGWLGQNAPGAHASFMSWALLWCRCVSRDTVVRREFGHGLSPCRR